MVRRDPCDTDTTQPPIMPFEPCEVILIPRDEPGADTEVALRVRWWVVGLDGTLIPERHG